MPTRSAMLERIVRLKLNWARHVGRLQMNEENLGVVTDRGRGRSPPRYTDDFKSISGKWMLKSCWKCQNFSD